MAPPGTPGAATMVIPSMRMNSVKSPMSWGPPVMRMRARAQETIFSVLPERCIVAQRGITKELTSSETPFFFVCASVTGIVAAEEAVPRAVK